MTLEERIIAHLKLREGEELIVYKDSLGKPTVGVGHLVLPEDELSVGDKITKGRSDEFLFKDMQKALSAAYKQAKEIGKESDDFIIALTSVNFQLGTGWTKDFYTSYPKLVRGDWKGAIAGFKGSKWARQTPVRVDDFVKAIEMAYNTTEVPSQPKGDETMTEETPVTGTGSGEVKSGVKTTEFWSSIVTTLVGAGVTIANEAWGWGLDAADILTFLSPILAYIFGRPVVKAMAK